MILLILAILLQLNNVAKLISKIIKFYLEIHNEKDGLKTFSTETRYDWYILKNNKVDTTNTIIKFQDGNIHNINVNGLKFIPNGEYKKIMSMVAKNGEENVYSKKRVTPTSESILLQVFHQL